MTLPTAMQNNTGLMALWQTLCDHDIDTRLVGGAVRDSIMNRPINDFDLAVKTDPQSLLNVLKTADITFKNLGIEHGTLIVISEGESFEISCLRKDAACDGRRVTSIIYGASWSEDARRRDLTINALSMDITGKVHDYTGGVHDIHNKLLRFVGDPSSRIEEDYLRAMRFCRFVAGFPEFSYDEKTIEALFHTQAGIRQLSAERITSELGKLMEQDGFASGLALMVKTGIYHAIISRSAPVGDSGTDPQTMIKRLAEIMDHTGFTPDFMRDLYYLTNGSIHRTRIAFIKLTRKMRQRLKTVADGDAIKADVMTAGTNKAAFLALGARHNKQVLLDGIFLAYVDGGAADLMNCGHIVAMVQDFDIPQFPLQGKDLIAKGVPPGPQIGALLDQLKTDWITLSYPSGDILLERLQEIT